MCFHDFEQIYDTYSNRVYSYIFLMVRNRETAEDLTQETFIKAYKKLLQFRGEAAIYTWLIQIARNTVFDFYKKKRIKELFTVSSKAITYDSPDEIVMKGEDAKKLKCICYDNQVNQVPFCLKILLSEACFNRFKPVKTSLFF